MDGEDFATLFFGVLLIYLLICGFAFTAGLAYKIFMWAVNL